MGFPGSSVGKESAWNAGDLGFIPGLGRCPGEGKGYPLQYSGLGNFKECIVHGIAKSRTRLSDFHFHSSVKLLLKIPAFGFIASLRYLLAFWFADLRLHCTVFLPCARSLLTCVPSSHVHGACLRACLPPVCTEPAYVHAFLPCARSLLTCVLAKLLHLCPTVCNPRECARQAPLSMAFPGQEYCTVGCHALLQGIFPTQGFNLHLLGLLHWQAGAFPQGPPGEPLMDFLWFLKEEAAVSHFIPFPLPNMIF